MSDLRIGQTSQARTEHVGTTRATTQKGEQAAAPPSLEEVPFEPGGLESAIALLAIEGAKVMQKAATESMIAERDAQVASLHEQVGELHDKALCIATEGWVSGAATVAAGAMTAYSGAASPTTGDATSAAFKGTTAQLDALRAGANLMSTGGAQLAKATAGAAQVTHDANATQAASDARFHESAKEQYDAIARDAKGAIDKANQALQSFAQERAAALHAIARM